MSRLLLLMLGMMWLAGCRERDAAPPVKERARAPAAAAEAPPAPAPPASRLTEAQRQALERIRAAGGSVDAGADDYPVGLDLASERVAADDELLLAVLQFPELKRLRLAVGPAAPETVARLAELGELEELFLQDAPLDDAALATLLRGVPLVKRLGLRRLNRVTDAGLQSLRECGGLSVLALIEMSGITGNVLPVLGQLPGLRVLDLRSCGQLARADFAQLVSLPGLTDLKLGGPLIDDDVLEAVARHPSVSALSIDDAQLSPGCLTRLAGLPDVTARLRSLAFTRCFGITDETLQVLPRLPQLEALTLREIMLNGAFLQYLRDSGDPPLKLRSLAISEAFMTDDALDVLPLVCPALERLDLSGNRGLTDRVLDILRQIPTLKEVRLERTAVTLTWQPGVE
ncbi:MAG: hypothetical protein MUF48_04385 [Pirellulaceae bacterium]|nr:hypothetical protein [Pirellulaceae bacterium]